MSNTTAIATQNTAPLAAGDLTSAWMSVDAIVARRDKIDDAMARAMREGEHFGKIPGTEKPTLLKPGAELLAMMFGLAPTFTVTRTDLGNGHREYEVTCRMVHIATGAILGDGLGSCSTLESKYRWRYAQRKCPACGADAILKSKKDAEPGFFCWKKKDGCGERFAADDQRITAQPVGRMENPDIADLYNTVLKMGTKRAQIAATLTVCGASSILTQDVEDMAPEDLGNGRGRGADRRETPARGVRTEAEYFDQRELELDALARELHDELDQAVNRDDIERIFARASRMPKSALRDDVERHFVARVDELKKAGTFYPPKPAEAAAPAAPAPDAAPVDPPEPREDGATKAVAS